VDTEYPDSLRCIIEAASEVTYLCITWILCHYDHLQRRLPAITILAKPHKHQEMFKLGRVGCCYYMPAGTPRLGSAKDSKVYVKAEILTDGLCHKRTRVLSQGLFCCEMLL
jgi:hypothetical protein